MVHIQLIHDVVQWEEKIKRETEQRSALASETHGTVPAARPSPVEEWKSSLARIIGPGNNHQQVCCENCSCQETAA